MPVVAAVDGGRVRAVRSEVQVEGAAHVRRVPRGRPIVAAHPGKVGEGVEAFAYRWQEDATAVGSGEQHPVNTVHRRPFVGAVACQFVLLSPRRHHPRVAPLHMGDIVLGAGDVAAEVVAGD